MRPAYRALQFWHALTAAPTREPPCALAPGLAALYRAMPRADRAHGERTYRWLLAPPLPLRSAPGEGSGLGAGEVPAALAAAALLHDVGKARPEIHLWDRVLFVLAGGRRPGWAAGWAGLRALGAHAAHGADLLAAAGAEEAAALVRHHHDDPTTLAWPAAQRALLDALQQADEAS